MNIIVNQANSCHPIDKKIKPIKALLSLPNLNIPAYQRPYKWSRRQVATIMMYP